MSSSGGATTIRSFTALKTNDSSIWLNSCKSNLWKEKRKYETTAYSRSRHGWHHDGQPPSKESGPEPVEDHGGGPVPRALLPAGFPVPAVRTLFGARCGQAQAAIYPARRR